MVDRSSLMAMGRRKVEHQQDLFVMADALPKSVGHVFYLKLNELLAEAGFDAWVEQLCEPYYSNGTGRPGIPPWRLLSYALCRIL